MENKPIRGAVHVYSKAFVYDSLGCNLLHLLLQLFYVFLLRVSGHDILLFSFGLC